MGNTVAKLKVDPKTEHANLHKAHEAAVGKAENAANKIEQRLRIAGTTGDNSLSVPISNIFERTVIAKVQKFADNKVSGLLDDIESSINDFSQGNITKGVFGIFSSAAKTFFETYEGSIGQEERYYLVMIGRSLVRIDTFMYTECWQSNNEKFQSNVVVIFRSPVDLAKLPLSSFINAYQYQVESKVPYSQFVLQCTLYLELYRLSSTAPDAQLAPGDDGTQRIARLTKIATDIEEFESKHLALTCRKIEEKQKQGEPKKSGGEGGL